MKIRSNRTIDGSSSECIWNWFSSRTKEDPSRAADHKCCSIYCYEESTKNTWIVVFQCPPLKASANICIGSYVQTRIINCIILITVVLYFCTTCLFEQSCQATPNSLLPSCSHQSSQSPQGQLLSNVADTCMWLAQLRCAHFLSHVTEPITMALEWR